jgi:hypothetical protein
VITLTILVISYWLLYDVVIDRFVRAHYRHSAGGHYLEQAEWERIRDNLSAYENGDTDITFNDEDSTDITINMYE